MRTCSAVGFHRRALGTCWFWLEPDAVSAVPGKAEHDRRLAFWNSGYYKKLYETDAREHQQTGQIVRKNMLMA